LVRGAEFRAFPADPEITTGLADEDPVLPHQWRSGRVLAAARVHDGLVPEQRTGCCVERYQMTI